MVWHGRGCESVIPVDDAEMPHFADWAECVAYLDGKRLGLGYRQELTAVSDNFLSIAVGEKSKVPDLHKSARQHMQEKPPDELNGIQGCLFDLVAILRIAPAKADRPFCSSSNRPLDMATRCVYRARYWSTGCGPPKGGLA